MPRKCPIYATLRAAWDRSADGPPRRLPVPTLNDGLVLWRPDRRRHRVGSPEPGGWTSGDTDCQGILSGTLPLGSVLTPEHAQISPAWTRMPRRCSPNSTLGSQHGRYIVAPGHSLAPCRRGQIPRLDWSGTWASDQDDYLGNDHSAECFHGAGYRRANATIASFCPGNNNGFVSGSMNGKLAPFSFWPARGGTRSLCMTATPGPGTFTFPHIYWQLVWAAPNADDVTGWLGSSALAGGVVSAATALSASGRVPAAAVRLHLGCPAGATRMARSPASIVAAV
jgi:hypothetical protein